MEMNPMEMNQESWGADLKNELGIYVRIEFDGYN